MNCKDTDLGAKSLKSNVCCLVNGADFSKALCPKCLGDDMNLPGYWEPEISFCLSMTAFILIFMCLVKRFALSDKVTIC